MEYASNSLLFRYFNFKLTYESIKELGIASYLQIVSLSSISSMNNVLSIWYTIYIIVDVHLNSCSIHVVKFCYNDNIFIFLFFHLFSYPPPFTPTFLFPFPPYFYPLFLLSLSSCFSFPIVIKIISLTFSFMFPNNS